MLTPPRLRTKCVGFDAGDAEAQDQAAVALFGMFQGTFSDAE